MPMLDNIFNPFKEKVNKKLDNLIESFTDYRVLTRDEYKLKAKERFEKTYQELKKMFE